MPTYEYQCRSCGTRIEVIHSMTEPGPAVCETCGGELRRVLYPTGIIFKGSGFYSTDSRSAGSTAKASSGDGSAPASSDDKAAKSGDAGKKATTDSAGSGTGSSD